MLVVCQHFWPESFGINAICEDLVRRGCDVDVLCGIPNYPEGRFYPGYSWFRKRRQIHKGIRIIRCLEIPRGSNTNFRVLINYLSYPASSVTHIPRLLSTRYDHVFVYQLSPVLMALAGILVSRLRRVPLTMYVLDLWPENLYSVLDVQNRFLRAVAERVSHWHYRRAAKLIALSESMKRRLQEITGLPDDRLLVLPQPTDPIYATDGTDEAIRSRFPPGFNIVFAGNISPAQDFQTLVRAAVMLRDEGGVDVNWIIVGDGMSRRDVEELVRGAGLEDRFFFEGFRPAAEIPTYHTMADALFAGLVQSDLLGATVPMKVMSYIAAGRPLLLAMDGEGPELVSAIGCGLVCPAGDAQGLADNVRRIYAMDRRTREEMGNRGRDYHLAHLEQARLLDRFCTFLFESSVGGNRQRTHTETVVASAAGTGPSCENQQG